MASSGVGAFNAGLVETLDYAGWYLQLTVDVLYDWNVIRKG